LGDAVNARLGAPAGDQVAEAGEPAAAREHARGPGRLGGATEILLTGLCDCE
jgi:hypothetical protein